MKSACKIKGSTKGIDSLVKSLIKSKYQKINVGILKNKGRTGEDGKSSSVTNAEIGAKHEMGSGNFPRRSFLYDPLSTVYVDKLKSYKHENESEIVKSGMKSVAIEFSDMAWKSIDEAFETGGFGAWPQNSAETLADKEFRGRGSEPLIDSNQLRASITAKVVK